MADNVKDPDALLDYTVDWSAWLASSNDFIVSANFSAQAGVEVVASLATSTLHTFWLSGGTVGIEYRITSRITTNGGRVNEQTYVVAIEEL